MSLKNLIPALVLGVALGSPAMEVECPKGPFALKDHPRGGAQGFCAGELASALKGNLGKDDVSRYPVLSLNGKRIVLSTTSALASVDGKIVKLREAPVELDGCLWLPTEFLTAVLPLVLGGPVAVRGAEPAPAAQDAKPEPKGTPAGAEEGVTVEVAVAADSVRVTLLGKGAPLCEVAQGAKEVNLTLPQGTFTGSPVAVGKGIVDEVAFDKGGRKLRVLLGPGFRRLESVKLRNPDRLVLLLKGEGQRLAPSPPPEPPRPTPEPEVPAAALAGEPPARTAAFDTVVLDPGHGGTDNGATAVGGMQEKNLTLALAQKTAVLLQKEGLRVILTRSTDTQVPLVQRTAIGNFNRADLFLSIHLNSSPAPSARGTETYYLSREATDQWSTQLAAKENTADEGMGTTAGDGGLNLVLWELAQASFIVESAALAESIQQEFNSLLGTANRGVRQAPFTVLEGAQMPAVLVEVAFLSNAEESKRLADPAFQDQVAGALSKSVLSFKASHEKPQTPPPSP